MKVKIKKVYSDAVIPKYARPGDAAVDLVAIQKVVDHEKNQITYDTGLAFEIPENHVGLLFPRSSICKTSLSLSNAVGVIDSSFRGTVKFVFNKIQLLGNEYYEGDRVGQLIIMPYPSIEFEEVEELSNTERQGGGFGSTGR